MMLRFEIEKKSEIKKTQTNFISCFTNERNMISARPATEIRLQIAIFCLTRVLGFSQSK